VSQRLSSLPAPGLNHGRSEKRFLILETKTLICEEQSTQKREQSMGMQYEEHNSYRK